MKINTPAKTLIKNFTEKRSGKKSLARDELKIRFEYLDFADQKKIVLAFLNSCKTDRNWMYKRLYDFWDKSFAAKVQELWEAYREEACACVVARHLPEEYVLAHIDELPDGQNYYYASLRVCNAPGFVLNKARFGYKPLNYLEILIKQNATLGEDEAAAILWGMVRDIATEATHYDICSFRHINAPVSVSATDCKQIYRATEYLSQLGCEKTLDEFNKWNWRLCDYINTDVQVQEFSMWWYKYGYSREVQRKLRSILVAAMNARLPEKYRALPYVLFAQPYSSLYPTNDLLDDVPSATSDADIYTGDVRQRKADGEVWQELKEQNPAFKTLEARLGLDVTECPF